MRNGRKTRYPFEPDYAMPPGATLQETIDTLGMTQRELAMRTGLAAKTINEIVKGKAPITADTAVLLERVTGVRARMWNNLESNYREQLARTEDRERLGDDLAWLKRVPTRELIKRGSIPDGLTKESLLDAVLRFFGVGNVDQWREVWLKPEAAFRKSQCFESKPEVAAAWLRLGQLEGHEIATEAFESAKFRSALTQIRNMSAHSPDVFQSQMVKLAADAGVAVVFVPELKGCPASGAAYWLGPKAVIQLSLRHKSDDHFWFSFFHEAGHVLNDPKKEVFIDDGGGDDECEERANSFSATFLIPRTYEGQLAGLHTQARIVEFARQIGIAPGIVVGRLQKEGLLPWATPLNRLKQRFEWRAA